MRLLSATLQQWQRFNKQKLMLNSEKKIWKCTAFSNKMIDFHEMV